MPEAQPGAEVERLKRDAARQENWKRWGPYLSERQWGTVREDYSKDGDCWDYFTHDDARGRAYRWGEDGLLGWCDRECRLCFSVALWNGRDPFLKERVYGLTNSQGNHGEDPKELYHYLDATPTYSYAKALYKYPQAEFPYEKLLAENRRRGRDAAEYEIVETGVFDDGRYFDVTAEYAKAGPDDTLIKLTVTNRASESAKVHVLPTLLFRNGWSWGCDHDGCFVKPSMKKTAAGVVTCEQETLGEFVWHVEDADAPLLFTENETDVAAVFGGERTQPYTKDAFHRHVVGGEADAVNPEQIGTKAAAHFRLELNGGESKVLRMRLVKGGGDPFADFDAVFEGRQREADAFYDALRPADATDDETLVWRQAYAGLLWGKQFYHYVVRQWLEGDPAQPPPPPGREETARNRGWKSLFNYDVLSVPDKWEFPWYAAWDLAFHMLPMARVDPSFAKGQLMLLLREWYMRPDGAIPAYEFAFSDANPPVHAWACWRVYKVTGPRGKRDRRFLASCFHKLLLNFTWWVNRKDDAGKHVFGGGFLGLDNIGVFDRSDPPGDGKVLEQADGTAWMAFYCVTMLGMALELASEDPSYEDIASKFFEHFAVITKAMNHLGGTGLWDETDGFYYDQLYDPKTQTAEPLRLRSMVGLVPLMACAVFDADVIDRLPGFRKRMEWFLENQPHLGQSVQFREREGEHGGERLMLLSVAPCDRMERVLGYVFDPAELLSDFGVRSLSKHYAAEPFELSADGKTYRVGYEPGEATGKLFGGNSNWRGPVWFPLNFLLVEALERYGHFFGDEMTVSVPDCDGGDARAMNLTDAAAEVQRRLVSIFLPGTDGDDTRPVFRGPATFQPPGEGDEGNLLFFEYFDGDTGRGCGANHQTGWTSLVALCVENQCRNRAADPSDGDEEVHGVDLGDTDR